MEELIQGVSNLVGYKKMKEEHSDEKTSESDGEG